MIILDTNVLSNLMALKPDGAVTLWLDSQPRDSIWITSVTLMELRFGLYSMPAGQKKQILTGKLEILLGQKLHQRVAPFDSSAAEQTARLMASRKLQGRVGELRDTMIAGIVLACNATLATRNMVHFQDLADRVINPWAA